MISDDFETFIDDNFWRWHTKTKILVKKIIHFIKIQNIHSIKIFIFLKSRIFIQTKYSFFKNPEYSFRQNIHFFKKGRIEQGYRQVHLGGGNPLNIVSLHCLIILYYYLLIPPGLLITILFHVCLRGLVSFRVEKGGNWANSLSRI